MSLYYREKLISDLADLIDIYIIQWGEYEFSEDEKKLVNINSLQEEYLKQDLKNIISESVDTTELKITLNDILTYNKIVYNKINSEEPIFLEELICECAERNSLNLIKYYSSRYYGEEYEDLEIDYNRAMVRASRYGHLNIVKYLKEKGAHKYEWAMSQAASGGCIDVIKYFESIFSPDIFDYNWAIANACEKGQFEAIKYLETRIPKNKIDYDKAMERAAWGGYSNIIWYLENQKAK